MRAEFDVKTKSEVFLIIDVFTGTVPATEISTLDPGQISTTTGTEMLGGAKRKNEGKKGTVELLLMVKILIQ